MHQPAASPCPDTDTETDDTGTETHYWCDRITYRALTASGLGIEEVERHSARTPAEAIRHIRSSVRELAAPLPPKERARALSWAEGGGWIGAIGALHRGEPCGFSLSDVSDGSDRSTWVEWTVHPYPVFRTPPTRQLALLPSCPPRHLL